MNHNQKIIKLKNLYEKKNFKCKRNFHIWRKDRERFSRIDICCFHKTEPPRCFEVELSGSQVLSNAEDLEEFKKLFPEAKVCQISTKDSIKKCFEKKP